MIMQYVLFKLSFKSPVHFGTGRLSESSSTVCADTLFSALYMEALCLHGAQKADELRKNVLDGKLLISDTLPYCGDMLFVPKPVIYVDGRCEGDSSMKKLFKDLKYIPYSDMALYLQGNYDPTDALRKLDESGCSDVSVRVRIIPGEDSLPYNVGIFRFNENNGLYFICGYEDNAVYEMICDIVSSLSYSGIGGKISSGYGRFDFTCTCLPAEFEKTLTGQHQYYMSLSVCLGVDENENDRAVDGSYFELVKRSGFVGSETYYSSFRKKKDLYCFRSGSCFRNRFNGCIADVSDGEGTHQVYRYAMPLFYGLDKE